MGKTEMITGMQGMTEMMSPRREMMTEEALVTMRYCTNQNVVYK